MRWRWLWPLLALMLSWPAAAREFRVEVQGLNSATLRQNVETRLAIRSAVQEQTDAAPLSDRRLRALHRRAEQDIREALQPYGYYDPVIRGEFDLEGGRATYTVVELGPRTRVRDIQIDVHGDGADFAPLQAVLARLQLQPGEPLRHERYEADKTRLSQAAIEFGFLDARFEAAELWVFADEQAADIEWRFDTGPRWSFGEISIEAERIDEAVVRRYLRLREGEPFSPRAILDTQFALSDLGYFDEIELIPEREREVDGRIPIRVRTTPRKDALYSAGIGFGTDTGARLSLGSEWRRWNPRGHKLRTDLRVSEIQNRLVGEYRIPLGMRIGENLSFSAGVLSERFDTGDTLKYELGVGLDRIPGRWKRRSYLNFEQERFELGLDKRTTNLLIPGLSFTRSEVDDEIHPRRGWHLFIDVHGAYEALISSTSFLQTTVQSRVVLPLWDRARLLLRGEYGVTFNDEFASLPASQRFFAGGDQSVRGYAFRSIGPRDDSGQVIGGEYLTTASVELEQRVWGNIGLAAFYDLGGADDNPSPALFRGVGAGLRYRAPIGFINLDLAWPLDRPEDKLRLHIGVRVGL